MYTVDFSRIQFIHYDPDLLLVASVSRQRYLMVFYRKSLQVSWILVSIVADFNGIWMVWIRPPISISSSPLSKPLRTISTVQYTIDITVIFIFHGFPSSFSRSKFLPLKLFSLIF